MTIGKLTLLHWQEIIARKDWLKDIKRSDVRRMIKEIERLRTKIERQGIHYHTAPSTGRVRKLGKLVDGMD